LDGKHEYGPDEYPSEEFRIWRLVTLMGCKVTDIDDQPATALDWLLAVDDTIAKYRHEKEEEAYRRAG
jgi:hypothetical protein